MTVRSGLEAATRRPGCRIGNLGRALALRQRSRVWPRVRTARVRPMHAISAAARLAAFSGGKSTDRGGLVLAHNLDAVLKA